MEPSLHPEFTIAEIMITYLHYYSTTETEKTPRGERFLDNRKFEGSIPEMVDNAVNYIMASIRKSSLIKGLYRELRSLVQIGLAEQHETKRWAYYTLSAKVEDKKKAAFPPKSAEGRVLEYVREHGYIKRGDCVKLLSLSEVQARDLLFKMRDQGLLKQEGTKKATRYMLATGI